MHILSLNFFCFVLLFLETNDNSLIEEKDKYIKTTTTTISSSSTSNRRESSERGAKSRAIDAINSIYTPTSNNSQPPASTSLAAEAASTHLSTTYNKKIL